MTSTKTASPANRLSAELQRLYPRSAPGSGTTATLVLELRSPADWGLLSRVWQGVQADLQLPQPAIAVNGTDGCQLWFSFAHPVPTPDALVFLEALRARYLAGVPPGRLVLRTEATVHPPAQAAAGQWSSFIAPDLAALFSDEPWLDMQPGADAQAELLSRLLPIRPADFLRALEQLQPAAASIGEPPSPAPIPGTQDPRSFLLAVMNDGSVELRLRIEAAKALLSVPDGPRVDRP